MTTTARMTIHDVELEDSPHMYVFNNGPRVHGTVAHTLIPHTSRQTGDAKSFELPMTNLPIDLADWAPKEELLRNPEIRDLWQKELIDFVPLDKAKRLLGSPMAQAEIDRLRVNKQSRQRLGPENMLNGAGRLSPEQAQADARDKQYGGMIATQGKDLDNSLAGVSPPVIAAMEDAQLNASQRVALLSNLVMIMTERDRAFVRSRTEDPEIRRIVAEPAPAIA